MIVKKQGEIINTLSQIVEQLGEGSGFDEEIDEDTQSEWESKAKLEEVLDIRLVGNEFTAQNVTRIAQAFSQEKQKSREQALDEAVEKLRSSHLNVPTTMVETILSLKKPTE